MAMASPLSLSSTQIKKSKQLIALLSNLVVGGRTPPTWLSRVHLTTVPESNDAGSWYGLKVELDGFVTDSELYAYGKAFHEAVAGDSVEYDAAQHEAASAADKF